MGSPGEVAQRRMSDWRDEWLEANRANWDERVPIHAAGEFYDVAGFKADQERLRSFEISEVGDVTGKELVHLQCHFGIETLSWARRGARVVGLDFSAPAIDEARGLAAELGLDADFVQSDVYEARSALGGRDFDVVYTGLGALNWLPVIRRWAGVVAALVRPGGFLYLSEFHPFSFVFEDDDLTAAHDYFHNEDPEVWDESGTYADLEAETIHNRPTSGITLQATWSAR
jgi:2-polyprenyl-3-methyl-5-hydroxy-6-metoxy-1,4-benzoquinol methylase